MNGYDPGDLPIFPPEGEEALPEADPAVKQASKFFDLVELVTFTVLIILLISTFFIQHSVVDGTSMEGTLSHGDHLLISDFLYTPKAGDIVVFQPLNTDSPTPYIKRVIATAGQTVEIRDGIVHIDGVMLKEDYIIEDFRYTNYPATTIPEGFIFVLGDNRPNSTDSRSPSVGLVDVRSVIGRVVLRLTPFAKFGPVN